MGLLERLTTPPFFSSPHIDKGYNRSDRLRGQSINGVTRVLRLF